MNPFTYVYFLCIGYIIDTCKGRDIHACNQIILSDSLTAYVREEIFQTLAVIVKRGILEHDSIAKDKIFNEVTQLISTGDLTMVSPVAC